MSAQNPRSDKWAEWYALPQHQNVLSTWGESNGREPQHETLCPNDPDPHPDARPDTVCWCSAFCGFCDHHEKRHTYAVDRGVWASTTPCTMCPDGICPRG